MSTKLSSRLKYYLSRNDKVYNLAKKTFYLAKNIRSKIEHNKIEDLAKISERNHYLDKRGDTLISPSPPGDQVVEIQQKLKTLVWSEKEIKLNHESVEYTVEKKNAAKGEEEIFIFPDYRGGNPYQNGLYLGHKKNHYISTVNGLLTFLQIKSEVLHLHWTSEILKHSSLSEISEALRGFTEKGGRIIWFIHNFYPHGLENLEIEKQLRTLVGQLAVKIVLLNPFRLNALIKEFNLEREKLMILPHGNYDGYIGKIIVREKATTKPYQLLLFGKLKRYKGVLEFLKFIQTKPHILKQWHVVIAGLPEDEQYKKQLLELGDNIHAELILKDLSSEELVGYVNESDIVVQNYVEGLNSGVTMMAMSIGTPVVSKYNESFRFYIEDGSNGFMFKDEAELEKILLAAPDSLRIWKYFARGSIEKFNWNLISYSRKLLELNSLIKASSSYHSSEWGEINYSVYKRNLEKASTAIIVLNFNSLDRLTKLYYSLLDSNDTDFEIIVVDNASATDEGVIIRNSFQAHFVQVEENCGYAVGNNIGLEFARSFGHFENVLILNPDCEVKPNFLREMRAKLTADQVLSCQVANGLSETNLWFKSGCVQFEKPYCVDNKVAPEKIENDLYETSYLSGACLFMQMETMNKVGPIPEEYFLYFEETDWCTKAKSLGIKLQVLSKLLVYHMKDSEVGDFPKGHFLYYYLRNRHLFFQKWVENFREDQLLTTFETSWRNRMVTYRDTELLKAFDELVLRAKGDARQSVKLKIPFETFKRFNLAVEKHLS